jgi:mannose-6-phosphate isomerase
MPILVKLLAAARPLSIQIHPSAQFAQAQFEAQQADPEAAALLADPHAKAEILIALEPFTILEGFRDPLVSAAVFEQMGEDFAHAAHALRQADVETCVRGLLSMPRHQVAESAPRLMQAMQASELPKGSADVMAEVLACYPDDPGVFVAALLNSRTLRAGEAVYVEPGTVHAYVRGLGIEVMTNSDNVLRLGLTSKTVAVDEALQAVSVTSAPHDVDPETATGVSTYAPPGAPFEVSTIEDADFAAESGAARCVVCLAGTVRAGDAAITAGQAILLDAADESLHMSVAGRAVVARSA